MEKETWLQKNAIPILSLVLSLAVIVGGGLYTYGSVRQELLGYKGDLVKVEMQLKELNAKVDAHHTDTQRHLDQRQWDMLMSQISELKQLIQTHMRRTGS